MDFNFYIYLYIQSQISNNPFDLLYVLAHIKAR